MSADDREPVVWLNDGFIILSKARISPLDRGFQYGDGLFETIRADNGKVWCLADHLQRLTASAAELRIPFSKQHEWEAIIQRLIRRNNLEEKAARVKIVLTRGEAPGLGLPQAARPTVLVTADEYHAPTQEQYRNGWNLHVFRQGYAPPLARHKSLNYLYFMAARQAATDAGCDEALILSPDGTVAETAAGSLLIEMDGQWLIPEGACLLPGTAQGRVRAIMSESGLIVQKRVITLDDLERVQSALVTNSLMGIIPVREIDGSRLPGNASDLAAHLRESFFAGSD
jgi:branched-chain amino acid aminotransferase